MAIYKLGELYSNDPQYGVNEKALESGLYHYVRQSDIRSSSFDKYVNSGPLLKKNDVLISRVGANAGDTYIHKLEGDYVYAGYLVRYKFNKKILLDEYFYYWTKTTLYQRQLKSLRTGAAQPQFNPPMVGNIQIDVPSIQEQQKIIDIIEQKEELFLKFSKTVRIDTFEHTKNDLKNLIDIIEPIEILIEQVNNFRNKLLIFILNLPFNGEKERISYFLESIKNKPKHINQVSAKVLNDQGTISKLEDIDTYRTNNFFTPEGSFVFCSIRTYLRKWGLLPYDVDSNGTLFQFSIKNNITSLISFLLNNNSWEKFNLLSSGTKMPVIKKETFLNVEVPLKITQIDNIDRILIKLNQLELKTNLLKDKLIKLLIK